MRAVAFDRVMAPGTIEAMHHAGAMPDEGCNIPSPACWCKPQRRTTASGTARMLQGRCNAPALPAQRVRFPWWRAAHRRMTLALQSRCSSQLSYVPASGQSRAWVGALPG